MRARLVGAAVTIAVTIAPAPAAGLPTISRIPSDQTQLRLEVATAPGQNRFLFVEQRPDGIHFVPETEPEPEVPWTINAPDCAVVTGTNEVVCTGPVTTLAVLGGEGNEGFETREFDHPVFTDMAGGDDSVVGGLKHDSVGLGRGNDFADTGRGWDSIYGWLGDDELFGGAGSDTIKPGPGADRIFGESGIERIGARDGERDRRIDCGSGDDRKERARVDRSDPRPRNC